MNQEPTLKRVLFVDDSLEYLEAVRLGLTHWSRGQWELVLTPDTTEAFAILGSKHIDLVVIDLHLGGISGVEFLKQLHRKHPLVRKAMLTGCEEDAPCKVCLAEGADLYLVKLAGFETIFHSLNQLFVVAQEGFRGLLRQVSLTDLIQLECLNQRTSILEMSAKNLRGEIYIKDGAIIHAQAGSKTGLAAFTRLMKMTGGDFHLKPYSEPKERTIDVGWEQLLMQTAQTLDEVGPASPDEEDAPLPLPSATREPAFVSVGPPDTEFPPMNQPRRPRAAEVLVVGQDDATLFEWQCASAGSRARLLRSLHEKCQSLCQSLNMGAPTQVDFQQPTGRALAHFQSASRTFCRTEYEDTHSNSEVAHV